MSLQPCGPTYSTNCARSVVYALMVWGEALRSSNARMNFAVASDRNQDMIDVAPALRANIFNELRQVGGVRLDGVGRGVALEQRTDEFRRRFLHDGCTRLCHSLFSPTEVERPLLRG